MKVHRYANRGPALAPETACGLFADPLISDFAIERTSEVFECEAAMPIVSDRIFCTTNDALVTCGKCREKRIIETAARWIA